MLSWTSGSIRARWNELIVGSIVSSSPFTTRTGLSTFARPVGEVPCSHFARAVIWAPIVSLETGGSRSSLRTSSPGEEGVGGSLAGRGRREEQEVPGLLALDAR